MGDKGIEPNQSEDTGFTVPAASLAVYSPLVLKCSSHGMTYENTNSVLMSFTAALFGGHGENQTPINELQTRCNLIILHAQLEYT